MTVWNKKDIKVGENLIGIPGSPTVVSGLEQAPSRERKRIFLSGTPQDIALKIIEVLGNGD